MDEKTKIAVIVGIIVVFAVASYFTVNAIGEQKEYQKKNLYCQMLTNELNKNITKLNTSSPCVSYYCYYNPVVPEKFYGKAQPLCECDCKTPNGTTLRLWVGSAT